MEVTIFEISALDINGDPCGTFRDGPGLPKKKAIQRRSDEEPWASVRDPEGSPGTGDPSCGEWSHVNHVISHPFLLGRSFFWDVGYISLEDVSEGFRCLFVFGDIGLLDAMLVYYPKRIELKQKKTCHSKYKWWMSAQWVWTVPKFRTCSFDFIVHDHMKPWLFEVMYVKGPDLILLSLHYGGKVG